MTVDDGGGAPRTVATRTLDALEPGAEVTERIGVGLGGLAWGASTLRAEVAGAGAPVAAESSTSSYPWALVAALVLAVQGLLLLVRNRVRRRVAVEPEPLVDAPLPAPLALPAVAARRRAGGRGRTPTSRSTPMPGRPVLATAVARRCEPGHPVGATVAVDPSPRSDPVARAPKWRSRAVRRCRCACPWSSPATATSRSSASEAVLQRA